VAHDQRDLDRARRLFEALNESATAMIEAPTEDAAVTVMAESLRSLGFLTTCYRVADDRYVLTHNTVSGPLLRRVRGLTGLTPEGFEIRKTQVRLLDEVVGERTALFSSTEDVMREVLGSALGGLAGTVIGVLQISRLIALPILVEGVVARIVVVLSNDLSEGDRPAMQAFATHLSAVLRTVHLRRAMERSLTDLAETQEQLLQAQRLDAIGRLAGGVAHDLNNVLTPVMLTAEAALLHGMATRDDLEVIYEGAQRAAETTRRLLTFARRRRVALEPIDARDLVAEVVKLIEPMTSERIVVRVEQTLGPAPITGDRTQLVQVVLNLAINALDAIPDSGTLRLRVTEDEVRRHPETERLRVVAIQCIDDGVGMSPSEVDRAFDPFFTTKRAGTGLGLSVAHGIIDLHGGWIELTSEPGAGTTASVRLPRRAAQAPPARAKPPIPPAEGRILVVEDRDDVATVVMRQLHAAGYSCLRARTLAEGRARLGGADAIVCDVGLPDGSGWSMSECGRPILFVTGHTMEAPPGVAVLHKPFHGDELLEALAAVRRQEPAGD
jgi:signal transduction histidine kinase